LRPKRGGAAFFGKRFTLILSFSPCTCKGNVVVAVVVVVAAAAAAAAAAAQQTVWQWTVAEAAALPLM